VSQSAAGAARERLLSGLWAFLTGLNPRLSEEVHGEVTAAFEEAGDAALLTLWQRLETEAVWGYSPPDRLAQRLHHVLAGRYLLEDSELQGLEHVASLAPGPLAICANHLSYSDANAIEVLLQRSGAGHLANRLTAIAGPKVFTSRQRRFSSLCFGTIKVPQSTGVSSEEAVQSAREVAQAARLALKASRERLEAGDALVLFGEGTRSRSGGMQPMLAGAARYLEVPGTVILPVGLTGSEVFLPVDGANIQPARVGLYIGRPLSADRLFERSAGDRRLVMDAIGLAIAEVLPLAYRGVYASEEPFGDAGSLMRASRV
jgi:1-acyl-sn-glycerol-3-phosphate acyltransferase